MLAAMQDHMAGGAMVPQIPTATCNALRRIAVNDQICIDFADAGGVTVTMQVDTQSCCHSCSHALPETARGLCLHTCNQKVLCTI